MDDTAKLKRLFPNASISFLKANTDIGLQDPNSQRSGRKALDSEVPREEEGYARPHLRITAYSVRVRDEDNLKGGCKALIDCIRSIGLIRNDDPSSITLEVRQKKVDHFKEEKTLVEIFYEGNK